MEYYRISLNMWISNLLPLKGQGPFDLCHHAPRLSKNHKSEHPDYITTNKWVAFSSAHDPRSRQNKKTWNDATVWCRAPVYFMQCAPIRRMTQAVGMNQPFGGLIWSQTSYQPSYMWHTRVSLMKADPRSEPGGVVALLNRKWTRSNAPIRLRCGETKHHHPTGRK